MNRCSLKKFLKKGFVKLPTHIKLPAGKRRFRQTQAFCLRWTHAGYGSLVACSLVSELVNLPSNKFRVSEAASGGNSFHVPEVRLSVPHKVVEIVSRSPPNDIGKETITHGFYATLLLWLH